MATTQYEGVFNYVDDDGNTVELYPEIKTDTTLKVSGKAADAAAVGEAIKNAGGVTTLTQAEYDALSEEEQNTGVYLISDGGDDSFTAKNITYDGTTTGLGNNVQSAIDILSSDKIGFTWKQEVLDCYANTTRYYTFPDLPEHRFSLPVVYTASSSLTNVTTGRDINTTGKVWVHSPVTQQVNVVLLVFI